MSPISCGWLSGGHISHTSSQDEFLGYTEKVFGQASVRVIKLIVTLKIHWALQKIGLATIIVLIINFVIDFNIKCEGEKTRFPESKVTSSIPSFPSLFIHSRNFTID